MSIITKIVRHNYGVAKLGHTMLLFGHAYNQEKAVVIKKTGKHDKDTGSSEVQIALFVGTNQKSFPLTWRPIKDNHSRRGLLKLVANRRSHQKYLETKAKKAEAKKEAK